MPDSDIDSCSVCGVVEVKFWREYSTFSPRLLCARHVAEENDIPVGSINEKGTRIIYERYDLPEPGGIMEREVFDIGWWVPAFPIVEDGHRVGWWGYTSVPHEDIVKWQMLPNEMPDSVLVVE